MEFNLKILEEIQKGHKEDANDQIDRYTNKFIKNITNNLENFSYNKIVQIYMKPTHN